MRKKKENKKNMNKKRNSDRNISLIKDVMLDLISPLIYFQKAPVYS